MHHGKTLVVFFCMHRSGSSFAGRLFQRLGMSLGPFELLGANESNPHGHFEALPFVALNRDIQLQAFGFPELPQDTETLQRLRTSGGQWPAAAAISDCQRQEGKRLVEQLVASGTISGFKDPRTVLTWPFWEGILREFEGLRVVPLFLLRSPHEIAMSLFRRAHGDFAYDDALDLATIHYRRMQEIHDAWRGDRGVLQYDPRICAIQAPAAAAMCGLKWDEAAFAETYDRDCRHHVPARVAHEVQTLFERLGGANDGLAPHDNLHQLLADAAQREQILRDQYHRTLAGAAAENRAAWEQVASRTAELQRLAAEKAHWEAHRRQIEAEARALRVIKAAWDEQRRSWGWAVLQAARRVRQLLVPIQSWREAAVKSPFLVARTLAMGVRQFLSL